MAKRAWAGLAETHATQPPVRHFHLLDDAAAFIRTGIGARAVGFFASVNAPEHAVFLTVAKRLGIEPTDDRDAGVVPPAGRLTLGRATVGRGTTGASIYLTPRVLPLNADGGTLSAVLVHRYRVPSSPADPWLAERWASISGASAMPTNASAMWHAVLEEEAMELHRFLERGALPDVVPDLDEATLPMLTSSAHAIGLLLVPPRLPAAMRGYHGRRLARAAARSPAVWCGDGMSGDDGSDRSVVGTLGEEGWLEEYTLCTHAPAAEATRYALANASAPLLALLMARLRLLPSALPEARHEPRFVLLRRPSSTGAEARAAGASRDDELAAWSAHTLHGPPSERAIKEFVASQRAAPASSTTASSGVPAGRDEL